MRQLNIGDRTWIIGVSGVALFALSAALRYCALCQTDFANGWDGYFYLVQLKSLQETGIMHSPEASLIYPYLRLFYWFTNDYVSALKTGSAVLAGLFTALVFWILLGIPRGDDMPQGGKLLAGALSGALLSVFSPQLAYFSAQFPKNLLGMVLLLAFIGSLPKKSAQNTSAKIWVLPFILLTTNYFGHRLTFVLAVFYLVFWLLFRFGSEWKKALSLQVLGFAALAGAGVLLAAGLFFPGLFHVVDLGRLKGAWSAVPHFAPWSFVQLFGAGRISGWWMAEIVFATALWAWLAGSGLAFKKRLKTRPARVHLTGPLWCLCTLLLFPFLEWSLTGMSFRLFLVFVLFTPLLVIDIQFFNSGRTGVIFAAILFLSSFFSWKSYHPARHDPDYTLFASATSNARHYLAGQSPELVIAHNALAEFYTFTSGTDAMPWLPEYPVDSSRLWRIAADVPLPSMRYFAGPEYEARIIPIGFRYILLPEYVWKSAVDRAKRENDEVFLANSRSWRNPSQVRPEWLLHRKRKI